LWATWTTAKSLGLSPSEYLRVEDPFVAYCLDRAVTLFGTTLENEIRTKTEDAKNTKSAKRIAERIMNQYLYSDDEAANIKGRFRDPMAKG
jgi:hypothetical protein